MSIQLTHDQEQQSLLVDPASHPKPCCGSAGPNLVCLIVALGILGISGMLVGIFFKIPVPQLSTTITGANLIEHLNKLSDISQQFGGSRGISFGFGASVNYIIEKLNETASCTISQQYFTVPIFQVAEMPKLMQIAPSAFPYQYGVDYTKLSYGGSGYFNVKAGLSWIPGLGCLESNYEAVNNTIAMIPIYLNASCSPFAQASYAAQYGAVGAILYNTDFSQTTLYSGDLIPDAWRQDVPLVSIPTVSVSYLVGRSLKDGPAATLKLVGNYTISVQQTSNLFCTSTEGDPAHTIVIGANLDSDLDSEGINDNGSGAAALLEFAIQWYSLGLHPVQRIVFAWWSAGTIGQVGSATYVKQIYASGELQNITAYINLNAIGSPNGIAYVANVTASVGFDPKATVNAKLIDVVNSSFSSLNKPYVWREADTLSDFYPFLIGGIPTISLSAGTVSVKSAAEKTAYGGLEGAQYDPCYSKECDTIVNLNKKLLEELAKAGANVLQTLAQAQDINSYDRPFFSSADANTTSLLRLL